MRYRFEVNIYTDGDFGLPFVPRGMRYDGDYNYSFAEYYKNRETAIESVLRICQFLKEYMHTSRDYVKESWDRHIDNFVEALKNSDSSSIYEYMGGNYEGTEFKFTSEELYINCGFHVNDEEHDLIKRDKNNVTNEMIKEAVMALFKNKMETPDGE